MSLSTHLEKYGDWALVAGGASGLGRAFCTLLAAAGKNLIVIDSDPTALDKTCGELEETSNREIIPVLLDLSSRDAPQKVIGHVEKRDCRLFVYNAAFGPVRKFETNTPEDLDLYIDLNARTLLHICSAWTSFQGDSPSGLLAVSSMAGMRGTLLVAPYAATKAFTWNLMESLYYEYRDTSLDFAAMCAGPISTPNYIGTQPIQTAFLPSPDSPEYVAEKALLQLGRRPVDFPGWRNRLADFLLTRILPRSWAGRLNNRVMARSYPHFWSG